MPNYVKQTWTDNNPSFPLSAARMGVIEQGISDAHRIPLRNTTPVGTGASTVETVLQTVVIGAAALAVGDVVHIRAGGTISGTNNQKAVRLYFGGATMVAITETVPAAATPSWTLDAVVVVTGASTQKASGTGNLDQVVSNVYARATYSAPANAISGAISVETHGTTTSAADEVTSEMLIVQIDKA